MVTDTNRGGGESRTPPLRGDRHVPLVVGEPAPALAAAGAHTVAHATYKGTLFMVVGIIDHQSGTRDLRRLSGLARTQRPLFIVAL